MLGQHDNTNLEVNTKKQVFLRFYGLLYMAIIAVIIGLGIVYLNSLQKFAVEDIEPRKNLPMYLVKMQLTLSPLHNLLHRRLV